MNQLEIIYRDPRSLIPCPTNARTHSPEQLHKLAQTIQRFGFNNPVLIGDDGVIVAGHGRVQAAISLKMLLVPTVRLSHLSADEKRACMLADNKLAQLAGWDDAMLAAELGALLELDIQFDMTDAGFEIAEMDLILDNKPALASRNADDDGEALPPPPVHPMCRPGDLWQLGRHLLFCGDSLDALSYAILMGADRAAAVFTDPPYNVPIDGHVSGLGRNQHREFAMASGEMSAAQFTKFLARAFQCIVEVSVPGSLHYVCMDWRHLGELLAAGKPHYGELKNLCVWIKANGGMGSLYRSQHELVAVWKSGKAPHTNNVELGKHGRSRTNVWPYPGMSSFGRGRDASLASHPTPKPLALVADAILDSTVRKGIVLDPFGGSGTTLLAAERTGRVARMIELDPAYCDVTLSRYVTMTGVKPINLWTGQQFEPETKAAPVPSAFAQNGPRK